MRRWFGVGLLLAGGLVLVVGPAADGYLYDRLARVPLDQDSETSSYGPDATFSYPRSGQLVTGSDLESHRTTLAQVEASREASEQLDRDVAVWLTQTRTDVPEYFSGDLSITDPEDQAPLSATRDLVAFDRHTGEVVDCCGAYTLSGEPGADKIVMDGSEDTTFDGLYFKFPFDTQQRDYDFWDGTVQQALPAAYEGTEEIDGLEVFRFVQTIGPTPVPGVEGREYSSTRTLWVEPETGVIIDAQEEQLATQQQRGEEEPRTVTDVTIGYDDETVQANVDDYRSTARLLGIVRTQGAAIGVVAGALLLLVGIALLVGDARAGPGRRAA